MVQNWLGPQSVPQPAAMSHVQVFRAFSSSSDFSGAGQIGFGTMPKASAVT
jgi:hypothetical protein